MHFNRIVSKRNVFHCFSQFRSDTEKHSVVLLEYPRNNEIRQYGTFRYDTAVWLSGKRAAIDMYTFKRNITFRYNTVKVENVPKNSACIVLNCVFCYH